MYVFGHLMGFAEIKTPGFAHYSLCSDRCLYS